VCKVDEFIPETERVNFRIFGERARGRRVYPGRRIGLEEPFFHAKMTGVYHELRVSTLE
jgi:hypothetical protein